MASEEDNSSASESYSLKEKHNDQDQTTPTNDLLNKMKEKNDYIVHLRRELRLLMIRNPSIKPFEISEIDSKLAELTVEELERILENVKIDLGVVQPCASGNLILTIIGTLMEKFLGMQGFTIQLLSNTELVVSVDSFLPNKFIQYGPCIKATESFMSEFLKYKKKDE